MSQPVRQPSFAKGEFSPTLWARTEYSGYGAGARTLLNFIVTPFGAAANRPGTLMVDGTRSSAKARLRDFFYSTTDALLMAFTATRIRFYTRGVNGVPGVIEASPGVPLEVVTPYAETDLQYLRFAQVGDVVRITCKGHYAYDLVRTSAAPLAFTFDVVSFDVPTFPAGVSCYLMPPLPAEQLPSYPGKQWQYKVTAICEDSKGNIFETKPFDITEARYPPWDSTVTYASESVFYGGFNWGRNGSAPAGSNEIPGASLFDSDGDTIPDTQVWSRIGGSGSTAIPTKLPRYPSKQVTVFAPATTPSSDPGYRILAYRVYCGRGTIFGYIGELTKGAGIQSFLDTGDTPDWSRTPPKGQNPFKVYDWSDTLLRTEKPTVVTFFEQRCVMARTAERPGSVFLSSVNAYNLFDEHDPVLAEDTLTLELAAATWQEIRALVPGRTLLAFTNGGEWTIYGGAEGAPVTPLSYAARPRTERGSSWVEPIKVGDDEVLFIPPSGNLVRELSLDGNTGKYSAADVSILSKHIFKGKAIVDWDWQEEPWSVVWVVLSDGTMASLTYVKEQEVVAWARHETDGFVESVCCMREGTEDAVYLVVRRTIGGVDHRFIERMASRQVTDAAQGLFLDCAIGYSGAPASHFTGLDHLEGETVTVLADGSVVTGLVVTGGAIDLPASTFPDGASVVWAGLPYVSDLELLDLPAGEGRTRVKIIKSVSLEYEGSRGGWVGQRFAADGSMKGLEEWRQRTVEAGYSIPLENGITTIQVTSGWNSGGRAVVRQVDPLPMTILAVSREVEYGGSQG